MKVSVLNWIKTCLLLILFSDSEHVFAQGLNEAFGIPIWSDNNLWDDDAGITARRLNLRGTQSRQGNETFRGSFAGERVLNDHLFAIDLYPLDGKVRRIVLAFANEADLARVSPGALIQLPEIKEQSFLNVKNALTKRIGRPSGEKEVLHWSWLGHTLTLKNTEKAVLLEIQPGSYSPNPSPGSSIIEDPRRAAKKLNSYVVQNSQGDVLISQIPKISQGSRNYCVPATWEKVLRHYGLAFNVYDLANEGDTSVSGSYYTQFTNRVSGMLKPHQYRVEYLRFQPGEIQAVKKYIDQGLPLIWHMNAVQLPSWVQRNRSRRDALPDGPDLLAGGNMAGHALLIIGYNIRNQELALSDSTDLGSSQDSIWIRIKEAQSAHMPKTELLAVWPPGKSGSGGHLKANWY